MTDPGDEERFADSGEAGTTRRPSFTPAVPGREPTQTAGLSRPGAGPVPPHPVTEAVPPRGADEAAWDDTATATGGPRSGGSGSAGYGGPRSPAPPEPGSAGGIRFGPGVPGAAPASQPAVSAAEVWRTGRLPRPPDPRRWRRRAGTALTAALLIACGVLVFQRLHHASLSVTGVAIVSQVKSGCAVDVTGRISTAGGAGTVSYEWVFTPQTAAPQPLSQSVSAGQPASVTVSVQGTGQRGQATRQVTLLVLSPGQGKASAHVTVSC